MTRRKLPKPIVRPAYDTGQAECSLCPYMALGGKSPCKPRINSNSRFLVVLDQPDPASVRHGELRRTRSQKLLEDSLAASGATDGVSYLFATACRKPEGAKDKDVAEAARACKPRLEAEINAARLQGGPDVVQWVLALGDTSFQSVTGKHGSANAWLGSPVAGELPQVKVICSFDPYFVQSVSGRRYGTVFQKHIDRYARLADGRLQEWVWPETVVDNCADALRRVLAVAKAGGEYGFDIEATGLDFDKDTITCVGFAIADLAVSVQLPCTSEEDELIRQILECGVMVGMNLTGYDRRMMVAKGYKITPYYHDLMNAHLVLEPQHKVRKLGWQAGTESWAPAWKSEFRQDESGNTYWGLGTDEQEREKRTYNARDSWMAGIYLWGIYKQRLDAYQ